MSVLIEASGKAWGDGLADVPPIEFFPARVIRVWRESIEAFGKAKEPKQPPE